VLPLLNSKRLVLPDVERLRQQLVGLERRVSRAGRDSIDHQPGGHDDLANAVAGVVGLAAGPSSKAVPASWASWSDLTPVHEKDWYKKQEAQRAANVANPQSAPCTIDFKKLERERELPDGLSRRRPNL
jgi:hypothetical protein